MNTITPYIKQNCEVTFEFGVADGFTFNFLDQKELDQGLKNVDETILETLDLFFAVRYHINQVSGKRVPLRFDYLVLRFFFQERGLELSIRHEKGTQRTSLEDLTNFLIKQINIDLSQRNLEPIFYLKFKKVNLY
ncbi:hypothetical protein KJN74_01180 [Candidatus Bathyarchaeota archaeon]|nr:hypothetical protein [Candidatus Bathyarchaeota archaeon]